MSLGQTIKGAFLASRVPNLLIIGFAQFTSAMMLLRIGVIEELDLALPILIITTMMVAAGGYVINDYYDAKIDMVNRPDEVVVGRALSRRKAMMLHIVLTFFAIAIGLIVSWKLSLVHLGSSVVLWYYSNTLRRMFIGKIVIAGLALVSILIVGFLYGVESNRLMAFAILGSAMIWVRELIKDLENFKGEHAFGVESVPEVWGLKGTKILIGVVFVVGSGLMSMVILRIGSEIMITYYAGLLPVVVWFMVLLIRADQKRQFARLKQLSNFLVLAGMASMYFV